ncbi:MAG: IMP dehydrogenase [Candidatus Saccharimonadales bacterium]
MNSHKKAFFAKMNENFVALTYDDVRLRTARSDYSTSQVSTDSKFSRNVPLKVPIVSAPMDTVTTSDMAITMAKHGGLGIIHAGLSIKEQLHEVKRVKLHLNGLIASPICVDDTQTVRDVLKMCEEKKYEFRTFPIVNADKKLVGLLTQNDIKHCKDKTDTVTSAMTPLSQIKSGRPDVDVNRAYNLMSEHKKNTLPLLNPDGTVAGLYIWSDVQRILEGNAGLYNVDKNGRLLVGAAVPTNDSALERIAAMIDYLDVVVLDTADGDSKYAFKYAKKIKQEFPGLDLVVGNITERNSARDLAILGVDGLRVGQGPSAICTTRPEIGIGCPQVTAINETVEGVEEAAKTDKKYRIPVCADGGINNRGDISIAIAARANSVMIGTKLAGTDESPGEIIEHYDGRKVKKHRGMGSPGALKDSSAARERYGGMVDDDELPLAEGIETEVPYQGSAARVLKDYTKALRKSMSYVGSKDIETHRQETRFWRITNAGLRESHTRV